MGNVRVALPASQSRNGHMHPKELNNTLFETGCDLLRTTSKTPPSEKALDSLLLQPEILKAERNGNSIAKLLITNSFTTEQLAIRLIGALGADAVSKMRDRKGESLEENILRRFQSAEIVSLLRGSDSSEKAAAKGSSMAWWAKSDS